MSHEPPHCSRPAPAWRQGGAVLLALLTACATTRHASYPEVDTYGTGPDTAWYELHEFTPQAPGTSPVQVSRDEFKRTVAQLARDIRASPNPQQFARQLLELEHEVEFLAQVKGGRIVRMVPWAGQRSSNPQAEAELAREYLSWCARTQGGGDCLGLLVDGPTLNSEDRYTLALAIALGSVLGETRDALKGMVSLNAVVAMVVCTVTFYMLLWAIPDPVVSKAVATVLTVALLAWLPAHTVWELLSGWRTLMNEAGRATTFSEVRAAGEKYSRVMGENTARVLVMLVMAGVAAKGPALVSRLPALPGFQQAVAQAEVQGGLRLAQAAEVESVAASQEGLFSMMVRSRGLGRPAPAGGSRPAVTTVIQHRAGNRQVVLNGQRWHLPKNRSVKDIPSADPVGDQLQAAATRAAQRWGPEELTAQELNAIEKALAQGESGLATLLEQQARGRFVHRILEQQFRHLKWNKAGVDAVDPRTGYHYEILSGTPWNMGLHGRRMMNSLFRMISF